MWQHVDDRLQRSFRFVDFNEAFGFMAQVALIAEKMDHHPEWSNTYNVVQIKLCTHSAGNKVTEKDHKFAERIDKVFARFY